MANVLDKEKQQQILALGRLGWSLRRIEKTTGIRRETASRYLRTAGIAVRPPGGWGHEGAAKAAIEASTNRNAKPAIEVSTDLEGPRVGRSPQASACEPFRDWIEAGVEDGWTAMALWQNLVDTHGFEAQYASVRRFVAKLRGTADREAHPRFETAPGEEAQVDCRGSRKAEAF